MDSLLHIHTWIEETGFQKTEQIIRLYENNLHSLKIALAWMDWNFFYENNVDCLKKPTFNREASWLMKCFFSKGYILFLRKNEKDFTGASCTGTWFRLRTGTQIYPNTPKCANYWITGNCLVIHAGKKIHSELFHKFRQFQRTGVLSSSKPYSPVPEIQQKDQSYSKIHCFQMLRSITYL